MTFNILKLHTFCNWLISIFLVFKEKDILKLSAWFGLDNFDDLCFVWSDAHDALLQRNLQSENSSSFGLLHNAMVSNSFLIQAEHCGQSPYFNAIAKYYPYCSTLSADSFYLCFVGKTHTKQSFCNNLNYIKWSSKCYSKEIFCGKERTEKKLLFAERCVCFKVKCGASNRLNVHSSGN